MISKLWKWFGILLGLTAVSGAIFSTYQIYNYEQKDDADHLQAKQDYLKNIAESSSVSDSKMPNIVVILFDDLGYGDVGAYGSKAIATPSIDALAQNGAKFTNHYSPSPVCSPSRAALLTGRYPPRAGVPNVLFPTGHFIDRFTRAGGGNVRIPTEEILLPEVLKAAGYRTGMVGKWHLGDHAGSLPNAMGFDAFYGTYYSNDMKPFAFYRNGEIELEAPVDQSQLADIFEREAVDFIKASEQTPFFLYFAHSFPHIPLAVAPNDAGKSAAGLYGDVVQRLDRSVQVVVNALREQGALDNTLIIVTSDNGPWYQGDPGNHRGRKNQTWEGGMKVPMIVQWPDNIDSGTVISTPTSGIDLFPTVAHLLDIPLPSDRLIDGVDISALLAGKDTLPQRYLYYFNGTQLDAIRGAGFKYHRKRGVRASDVGDGLSVNNRLGPWLFNLNLDPTESYNVSSKHPKDFLRLRKAFKTRQAEMENNPRGWR